MATGTRAHMIEQAVEHLRLIANDVDELGNAGAGQMGLNRTDLRALTVLHDSSDGLTAGELARALHVTSGATTRVIDNLAARGFVNREPDARDRRRILVRITNEADRTLDGLIFERLAEETRRVLERYQDHEIDTVVRFLVDSRRVLRGHARRLGRPGS